MTTSSTQSRSNLIVLVLGAALVAGFFLPWADFFVRASGWDLATDQGETRFFLVPLAGLALIATTLLAPAAAPIATLAAGAGITGWFGYHVGVVAAEVYGWGITMVVGGSVLAIGGALVKKPAMSMVGGFAMIGGFFCPWIDPGHVSGFDLARQNGLGAIAIAAWLVPVGGALAAYGSSKGEAGRKHGAFGGVVGLAAIGYLTYRIVGSLLSLFAGWGYILVIASGIVALVVGVARIRKAKAPQPARV
jgi:hypothetical protein